MSRGAIGFAKTHMKGSGRRFSPAGRRFWRGSAQAHDQRTLSAVEARSEGRRAAIIRQIVVGLAPLQPAAFIEAGAAAIGAARPWRLSPNFNGMIASWM